MNKSFYSLLWKYNRLLTSLHWCDKPTDDLGAFLCAWTNVTSHLKKSQTTRYWVTAFCLAYTYLQVYINNQKIKCKTIQTSKMFKRVQKHTNWFGQCSWLLSIYYKCLKVSPHNIHIQQITNKAAKMFTCFATSSTLLHILL